MESPLCCNRMKQSENDAKCDIVCLKDSVSLLMYSGWRMWIEWKYRECTASAVHDSCCGSGMHVSQSIVEFVVVWMCIYACVRAVQTSYPLQSELDETLFTNETNLASFVFACHCHLLGSVVNRWHSLWHTHSFKWNFASRHNVAHKLCNRNEEMKSKGKSQVWVCDENFA